MSAAMIARVMSAIPERAAWVHSGTAFAPHDGQGAQVKYLAQFLQWLTPLTQLTKDDQRALGLLATHQKAVAEDLELEADDGLEEEGELEAEGEVEEAALDFDPDATLPPPPERQEEQADVYATTT